MNKKPKLLLALVFFVSFASHSVSAMPILSSDGATLSGLEVGGELFNVQFLDGVLEDVYDPDIVATQEWANFAPNLAVALRGAFNQLGLDGSKFLLNGCETLYLCMVFIPDVVDSAEFTSNFFPAYYYPQDSPVDPFPGLSLDRIYDSTRASSITLARVERAIPIPGTLGLLLGGLLLASISCRRTNTTRFTHY